MQKLVLAMFASIDGYIAGPDGEFVSPPWSAQAAEAWAGTNLARAGHLIYGRVNFQFNKDHWTSAAAVGQPETATMQGLRKTVVSRTLSGDQGWNSVLLQGELAAAVAKLKQTVFRG